MLLPDLTLTAVSSVGSLGRALHHWPDTGVWTTCYGLRLQVLLRQAAQWWSLPTTPLAHRPCVYPQVLGSHGEGGREVLWPATASATLTAEQWWDVPTTPLAQGSRMHPQVLGPHGARRGAAGIEEV
jgi:hypothetical protein